ncbi:MAG TPA: transglutaminaseTgpA domain-containing protein [Solirubrobacteraceae bacterium]
MSALAQPAVLRTIVRGGSADAPRAPVRARPVVRLITFAALGCFGVIEWGRLMKPAPTGRLLGLLGIALMLVALGPFVRRYRKVLAPVIAVVALLGALAVCGVPLSWIRHVRIAVTADWIGQGLQALPGIYIPYSSINEPVRLVILLGAAVLLLDGALLVAFAPAVLSDLRRAGAALPLVALAVVPATLLRPSLPYAEGMLLFVLLAAFVWGERVRRDDLTALLVVCAVTGAAGMFVAPRLDRHKPWVDYQALSRTLAPGYVARFNWAQRYGPVGHQWPHTGRTVLKITAATQEYWKAEDFDRFDGTGWGSANYTAPDLTSYVAPSAFHRWTQTIQVTLTTLEGTDVIAAGEASEPSHLRGTAIEGTSLGTWTDTNPLHSGDSYQVKVYAPKPDASQLSAAGVGYPAAQLRHYLTVFLPVTNDNPQEVVFPLFGAHGSPENIADLTNYATGASVLAASPYRRAYGLARRLAQGAATPYAFVQRVLSYLRPEYGFFYDANTAPSRYPLLNFLFNTKAGYCQHFAGAMALLLRLGGVPARVAVGFTSGKHSSATSTWDVTDKDAHAWVEVWFPRYGWVAFDPTPGTAPEFSAGRAINPSGVGISGTLPSFVKVRPRSAHGFGPNPGSGGVAPVHQASSSDATPLVAGGLLLALIIAGLLLTYGPAERSEEALLAELERALERSARPVPANVTLAALEDRFGNSSEAASYLRTLRLARFAGHGGLPTPRQRRALRRQLRSRLGVAGALRALWALPPRWSLPRAGRRSPGRVLNSR